MDLVEALLVGVTREARPQGGLVYRGSRSRCPDMAVAVANVGACGASGCHAYSRGGGGVLGIVLAWFPKAGEEADGSWCCEERQDGLTCCGSGSRHLVPVMTMATYCAWG